MVNHQLFHLVTDVIPERSLSGSVAMGRPDSMTQRTPSDSLTAPGANWRGLGGWNLYFLGKLALLWGGYLNFHPLANLVFAAFLLFPLPSTLLRRARLLIALPTGVGLFYHDTWLPGIESIMGQGKMVFSFTFDYFLELLGRFINGNMVGVAFVMLTGYLFLARFVSMQGPWQEMRTLLPALLTATAPRGFAPDWIDWQQASGWQVTEGKGSVGSYDGIRVYLWLGMLSEDDPAREALVRHFHPMLAALTEPGVAEQVDTPPGEVLHEDDPARVAQVSHRNPALAVLTEPGVAEPVDPQTAAVLHEDDPARDSQVSHVKPMPTTLTGQGVPERVDTLTGEVLSRGDHGFAAALLPLASGLPLAAQLPQQPLIQGDGYYASVLTLFGHGWAQGRFRFAADGTLLPRWSDECQPVR